LTPSFPFLTENDDHCESPLKAYEDIQVFLTRVLKKLSKTVENFKIYDPYYCNGAIIKNLGNLGFPNVINQKEDCYQIWSTKVNMYPKFDVLITNPPYSGDHIERLLNHVTNKSYGDRSWFLLLPDWVHKKKYYRERTKHIKPFYIVPTKRYVYLPPKDFRTARKSDVHRKSSPFVSFWYVWGGTVELNEELIRWFYRCCNTSQTSCSLARSKSALRDLRRKRT